MREIAIQLERSPSTISREIRRNGGVKYYRASEAEQAAWHRAQRPKLCKLATHKVLRRAVATKLQRSWSPEQVAGWLKREYPGDEQQHVSTETIYKSLFIQARGAKKSYFCIFAPSARSVAPNTLA